MEFPIIPYGRGLHRQKPAFVSWKSILKWRTDDNLRSQCSSAKRAQTWSCIKSSSSPNNNQKVTVKQKVDPVGHKSCTNVNGTPKYSLAKKKQTKDTADQRNKVFDTTTVDDLIDLKAFCSFFNKPDNGFVFFMRFDVRDRRIVAGLLDTIVCKTFVYSMFLQPIWAAQISPIKGSS